MDDKNLDEKKIKDIKKTSTVAFVIALVVFVLLVVGAVLGVRGFFNLFSNLSIN